MNFNFYIVCENIFLKQKVFKIEITLIFTLRGDKFFGYL